MINILVLIVFNIIIRVEVCCPNIRLNLQVVDYSKRFFLANAICSIGKIHQALTCTDIHPKSGCSITLVTSKACKIDFIFTRHVCAVIISRLNCIPG